MFYHENVVPIYEAVDEIEVFVTDRQTDRQTDGRTDRQTDRQTKSDLISRAKWQSHGATKKG